MLNVLKQYDRFVNILIDIFKIKFYNLDLYFSLY
jgi:hypothetical protein